MSTATEPPKGTAPAAKRGRLAPVTRAFDSITKLMPTWAWGIFWLVVAILYGLYGDTFNDSLYESVIQTLAYVMMALGLNIVVGFAGLLDLG
jgi:branched-chain amino acid transport system permease protein